MVDSDRRLKFRPEYLAILSGGDPFTVAEIPENRYMPAKPPKFTERLLQLVWRNGLYDGSALKTTRGLPLKVVSPGRFNRAAGPDFKNASLVIGGQKVAGDVEIHKDAKEWHEHGHQSSESYNRVALHVFAERRGNPAPAKTASGREMHELEIGLYLRHSVETLHEELESAPNPVTGRPDKAAPCRKILAKMRPEAIENLLDLVGDGRMLLKSNRIIDRLESGGKVGPEAKDETVWSSALYEIMFECMGYSSFKRQFGRMARRAGPVEMERIIKLNPSVPAYLSAQAVFLKMAGLLGVADNMGDAEYISRLNGVNLGGLAPLFAPQDWPLAGCRPANYPQRRMAAFSHLVGREWQSEPGGAVGFFRKMLDAIPASDADEIKKLAKRLLENFTKVSDSFWDGHYSLSTPMRHPKKLVGKDKAVSLAVDCVVPYFLADCRMNNDTEMEHKLVLIYVSLPAPAFSGVTDYMTRNMLGAESRKIARPLRRQQALLQLYKDFCHRAPAACANCPFVEYLRHL